jgi:hypothetical protein
MASDTIIHSIAGLSVIIGAIVLFLSIKKMYKTDDPWKNVGTMCFIIFQVFALFIYGYGSVQVNKHFEDKIVWDNPDEDGDHPQGWWIGMMLTSFINIVGPMCYLLLKKEIKIKDNVYFPPVLVTFLTGILWIIIYYSVAPGTDDEGQIISGEEGVSIKDYFYFIFTTICVGVMGFFAKDGKKKEIAAVLAVWLVVTLAFIKFMQPKASLSTTDGPYSLSMLSDDWYENLKFNLYEKVERERDHENYWLPMSNQFMNFSGIIYLVVYVLTVLVPLFMTTFPYNILWLLSSALLIPLFTWLSNKAIALGTKSDYKYISSLDLYTNFVRGTHKEWDWEAYDFVDKVRLFIRLIIFVGIYGVPMFMGYQALPKPFNLISVLVWVLVFPILLSKLISHDCILSGDANLLLRKGSEATEEREIELVYHQHGGGINILALIVVGIIKILI